MCAENNVVASTLEREHALDEIRQNGLLPEPKRARNPIHVYHVGRLQSIREAEHWEKTNGSGYFKTESTDQKNNDDEFESRRCSNPNTKHRRTLFKAGAPIARANCRCNADA